MSDDLFPTTQNILSPRLQWMKDHEVDTAQCPDGNWAAYLTPFPLFPAERARAVMNSELAYATTEEEAVIRLAEKNNWKIWNQS